MQSGETRWPKDAFGLAVRLLGLYFLYLGLNGLTLFLGSDIIESPDQVKASDVIDSLLPVAFDLVVGCWLLRGALLIRWAYSDTSKASENLPAQIKRTTPVPEPAPPAQPTGMDQAEKKLAALVEKPR